MSGQSSQGNKLGLGEKLAFGAGNMNNLLMNNILNGAVDMDAAFADLNERYNAAIEKGVAEGEFKIEDYMNANYSTLNPSGE